MAISLLRYTCTCYSGKTHGKIAVKKGSIRSDLLTNLHLHHLYMANISMLSELRVNQFCSAGGIVRYVKTHKLVLQFYIHKKLGSI